MDLLAAGLVLFVLLAASYSRRGTWITLGSTALSIVLIAGAVFLSTAEESGPARDGLSGIAKSLPAGWDNRAQELAAALQRTSAAVAAAKKRTAQRKPEPILTASVTQWLGWTSDSNAEAEATPEPEPKPVAAASPGPRETPIKWLLEEAPAASNGSFVLGGANVSDQPLEGVRAVLKPDSGADELVLTIDVAGQARGAVPPGARFHLSAPALTGDQAAQLGGAILSFAYDHAGRRKTSIMYLTPPMLAQRTSAPPTTDR